MNLDSLMSRIAEMTGRSDLIGMCGLAEGTNANTLKTTTAITLRIYGAEYSKAVTDNIAMTACTQQAVSTYCLYLVSVNAAGTVTVTKGTEVATDTAALPATVAGKAPIGAFKVQTNGSTTFTSGTTDLSAAGLTVTYYDIDSKVVQKSVNEAMRKIERLYNFDHMKVRTTSALVADDHTVTNPITNYKELINAHIIDSDNIRYKELERREFDTAIRLYPDLTNDKGRPLMISRVATVESSLSPDISPTQSWLLRPTCDAAYTLDIQAYQYSPDLDTVSGASNWWTTNAPEVLLYGALIELEAYLINDARMSTWKNLYDFALSGLISNQKNEKYSGSKLNVRYDDVLSNGTYNIDNDGSYV